MAGVSTPAMAAAVTNAGGLGSVSIGNLEADSARKQIADLRARTRGPFNVNLFCHRPAIADPEIEARWIERFRGQFREFGAEPPPLLREIYRSFVKDEAVLRMLLEERPAVVSLHFGLPPGEWIDALRQAGSLILATATNLVEARAVLAAGVDAIVAQGWEAGGHRGLFEPQAPDERLETIALVRLLVREVPLPVIAAGGIMDGAGIAAALRAGAAAAQLGTAFIACDQSLADKSYRALLASDAARHTVMTSVISGRPARGIANRFTALGETIPATEVPAYPIAYDLGKALHAAAIRCGNDDFAAYWAGQGAARSRPMSAARLVETLACEIRN